MHINIQTKNKQHKYAKQTFTDTQTKNTYTLTTYKYNLKQKKTSKGQRIVTFVRVNERASK